jgi:hypothetical protein
MSGNRALELKSQALNSRFAAKGKQVNEHSSPSGKSGRQHGKPGVEERPTRLYVTDNAVVVRMDHRGAMCEKKKEKGGNKKGKSSNDCARQNSGQTMS